MRSNTAPNKEFDIFVPMDCLDNFGSFRKSIEKQVTDTVMFVGRPDSRKQWTDLVEDYMKVQIKDVFTHAYIFKIKYFIITSLYSD